jgi:hypothetical protein
VGRGNSSFVITAQGSMLFPDEVANISIGGVQLVCAGLQTGTRATLDLYNVARDFPVRMDFDVVYSLEMPSGHCAHGCAFVRELTNVEICGLR